MSTNAERVRSSTRERDPYKWHAIGVGVLVLLTPVCMFALVGLTRPRTPEHPWAGVAAHLGVEPQQLMIGEIVYRNNCALCHARDATGVPGLGKPLRNSAYVQSQTDEQLFELVARGRMPGDPENTTGAAMPARANAGLPDPDVRAVVAYLRTMQNPNEPVASLDAWQKPASATTLVSGPSGIGHDAFVASCSACHGQAGEGREGLGKSLRDSEFVASQTDAELIKFIKMGRPSWDEANTTGLDMPPKGGNPALSDDQIKDIVSYIREVHKSDTAG